MYLPASNHCHPQKHPTSESHYRVIWKLLSAKGDVRGHKNYQILLSGYQPGMLRKSKLSRSDGEYCYKWLAVDKG